MNLDSDPSPRRQATALRPAQLAHVFDNLFQGQEAPSAFAKMLYPHFRVGVIATTDDSCRRPEFHEWTCGPTGLLQAKFLENLVVHGDPKMTHFPEICLFLPERWLNPMEIQKLMQSLHNYCEQAVTAGRPSPLTQVEIVTQSAILLTDCNGEMVKVTTRLRV